MKNHAPEIIAGLSILLALLIPFHQKLTNNFWFHWRALWHYETAGVCLIILAIGFLLGRGLADGSWFSWRAFWHHEAAEACLVILAIGLLLGKYLGRI